MTVPGAVKNVVVIGASYAGSHAAELLATQLPKTHRVILIDKNSHFNHVYRFVRFGVVPGHEAMAFIPYTNVFAKALADSPLISEHHCPDEAETSYANSVFIHANVVGVTKKYVEVDRNLCEVDGITENCVVDEDIAVNCSAYKKAKANGTLDNEGYSRTCLNGPGGPVSHAATTTKIRFDYLIFATGSIMPRPLCMNARTKVSGMRFLQEQQDVIARASSILVVGGGALGIQYATDIADLHPSKRVTLIHSRQRLLPMFSEKIHEAALKRLGELGVDVILGDRVILPQGHVFEGKELDHRIVHTEGGRAIETDLQLFCTGQKPNTQLVKNFLPVAVGRKDGLVKVKETMQIKAPGHNVPHMFAVGDCVDAFGAIKAGHTGWNQATVAARNIVSIVEARETGNPLKLENYVPTKPMISVSLGLSQSVKQLVGPDGELVISEHKGEAVDSHWEGMWSALGCLADDPLA